MTPFRQIDVADRSTVFPYIYYNTESVCGIPFTSLYGWAVQYETSRAIGGTQTLVIRLRSPRRDHPVHLCPLRRDDNSWIMTIKELMETPGQEICPLVSIDVTSGCKKRLEKLLPDGFVYIQDDDYIDYVYLRGKLTRFNGKKPQLKHNHINRFEASYPDCHYPPITMSNLGHMVHFADRWPAHAEATGDPNSSLHMECEVIQRFLDNHEASEMRDRMIEIGGEIVAFTLGSPITEDIFGTHIKKVRTDIDGAYTVINREFARSIPEQYAYVNREEDLGLPGLCQVKKSYRSEVRLVKRICVWRRPNWAGEPES